MKKVILKKTKNMKEIYIVFDSSLYVHIVFSISMIVGIHFLYLLTPLLLAENTSWMMNLFAAVVITFLITTLLLWSRYSDE